MKVCCRCNVEKPFAMFAVSKQKKDGYTYACKECIEKGRKERLALNPERAAAIREKDAQRKRDKAEEISAKLKHRRATEEAFAERTREYGRKFRERNLEKERKHVRQTLLLSKIC